MKSTGILTVALCAVGSALALAQSDAPRLPPAPANAPAPSVQAPIDSGYAEFTKQCKTPPPARGGRAGAAGARGAAPAPGAAAGGGQRAAQPAGPRDYTVTEIPGVIAAGQRWKFLWQEAGNNGDGIVGTNDGKLLLAQNDNSKVLKLENNGKTSVAFADTHTGGAVSISPKGAAYVVERGLKQRIEQLTPKRKVLAETYQGEPLDCIGGVINDVTADSKGGVYFTMGGVYYASPQGVVTKYGNVTPNGIVLSANEKTLYVTNGPTLAAFDVQPDGSLTNQREFAKFEGGGNGDGSTIDAAGRIYVTTNPGVQVISAEGKYLGLIPTPRGPISTAFGGKDKKTLFVLLRGGTDAAGADVANVAQVFAIPTIAQGYKGRAK